MFITEQDLEVLTEFRHGLVNGLEMSRRPWWAHMLDALIADLKESRQHERELFIKLQELSTKL